MGPSPPDMALHDPSTSSAIFSSPSSPFPCQLAPSARGSLPVIVPFSVKGTSLDVTGVGWQRQVGWHLLTPAINLMETLCEHMHPGIPATSRSQDSGRGQQDSSCAWHGRAHSHPLRGNSLLRSYSQRRVWISSHAMRWLEGQSTGSHLRPSLKCPCDPR